MQTVAKASCGCQVIQFCRSMDFHFCKKHLATEKLVEACKDALAMFEKGHAIDKFDWGKSVLDASAIRELNETPGKIRAALKAAEEEL